MAKRFNIRMAGVGGQGVVTGSHILSTAVINAGGESTIVPFYGSEKRMAPVESYVRVSDEPIYEIGEITFPHIIIIFHPQVITHGKSYTMPFYFGLKEDGVALINNDGPMNLHKDQDAELKKLRAKLYYFPATKLSLEVAGMDLATNMALMGSPPPARTASRRSRVSSAMESSRIDGAVTEAASGRAQGGARRDPERSRPGGPRRSRGAALAQFGAAR